ncbi:MAG: hypothetical protein GY915_00560 [bacterium]|nr:hypothetical protein [bacterium]
MIAILYRFHLLPDKEEKYKKLRRQVADYFKKHRGALGSSLHRCDDGLWVAYSRWPDRKTWSASWKTDGTTARALPSEIQEAIVQMKACSNPNKDYPEIVMDVIEDQFS